MKKNLLFGLLMSLLVVCFHSSGVSNTELSSNQDSNLKIRSVKYENVIDLDEDYKSANFNQTKYGFVLTAKKDFKSSIFCNIDFVSESTNNDVEVTYEAKYYESEGRAVLDVYEQVDDEKIDLLDTLEGLITVNSNMEPDMIFADKDETIYLSQLIQCSSLDSVSWWDGFCKWVTGTVNQIKEVVVSGLRLMTKIAVKIVGLDGGASLLNMTKDSQGIYHAGFDCWQQYAGYNDFYDFVFNLGSVMSSTKNDFYDQDGDGDTDYILWGWKGDYWELGYGAELGIYKRLGNSELWYVDKNLSIDMVLKVDYRTSEGSQWKNVIYWNPATAEGYSDKQWWITGFNPSFANMKLSNSKLLRATYTVKFVTKGYSSLFDNALHDAFKAKWVDSALKRWSYDYALRTFTYDFI